MIIKLNGEWWKVDLDAEIEGDTLGLCELDTKTIKICRDLTGEKQFSCFIHEVLHALQPTLCEEEILRLEGDLVGAIYEYTQGLFSNGN